MLKKTKIYQKKVNSYLYDHIYLKNFLDYGLAFFMSVLSAAIFAFGVNSFLMPTISGYQTTELVSGGSSGLAQVIALAFKVCGIYNPEQPQLVFSIAYICINAPLLVLAFKGIGKRFATFTLINVACVFIFTNVFRPELFTEIALFVDHFGGLISRALFAGLCTGLSSAIAFKWETSAGGFDIVSYYLSLRKQTTAGKYGIVINATIITAFALLTACTTSPVTYNFNGADWTFGPFSVAFSTLFFSIIYLFTVMLVIDAINVRNKKVQISINTENKDLPHILLARIPHGATVVKATGAYSEHERTIIYMVVSSLELKQVIQVVKELDPNSFVNVTPLQHVYGRFFLKPIK